MSVESGGEIYRLIPLVMSEIGSIGKNRKNEQQKYSFRGIEDFYLAAHPAFAKHGVFCAPEVLDREEKTYERTNDFGKSTTWRHVVLRVCHRFFAGDGSHVDVTTIGEGLDNSDKASNKAMSGAMKYALIELFAVPTQDVEDSDRTTPEIPRTTKDIPISSPRTERATAQSIKAPAKAATPTEEAAPAGVAPPAGDSIPALAEALVSKMTPDPDATIDLPRQRALHRSFKDSIPANAADSTKKNAEIIFREWLSHEGYKGPDGKGSTKGIPVLFFDEVKNKAEKYAGTLR